MSEATYYNEFFEGYPKLPKDELKAYLEQERMKKRTFVEHPTVGSLTKWDIWQERAKFYFLPFLIQCYQFTKQNKLPHFTLMCSPTYLFYKDRLHLRNFMDTIHQVFFKTLEMCLPKGEPIMLLVERRFHIENPVDGGTQQLYNMLWDVDLVPEQTKCILPPPDKPRIGLLGNSNILASGWTMDDINPDMPESGLDLARKTMWLQDDLNFLCKRYDLSDEFVAPEILDLSGVPEEKRPIWEKTARVFHFRTFLPKDIDDEEDLPDSTEDWDPDEIDGFDSTIGNGLLDSTLDFEQEEEDMNKIIAFFAKVPKLTNLVQGMVDMMTSLTRILPLVIDKLDDDKLKQPLIRTVDIINLGLGKVMKICAYLGIKVQKTPNGAIKQIVKNRFNKDKHKQDFLEYEVEELNRYLDMLENVDELPPPPPVKGKIPLDVKPNHLYPQRMPLDPVPPPPPPPKKDDGKKPEPVPPKPVPPLTPPPPKPEPSNPPKNENDQEDHSNG